MLPPGRKSARTVRLQKQGVTVKLEAVPDVLNAVSHAHIPNPLQRVLPVRPQKVLLLTIRPGPTAPYLYLMLCPQILEMDCPRATMQIIQISRYWTI